MSRTTSKAGDLSMTRLIRAPRADVWAAWTDPASFAQWWLPAPLTCRVLTLDVRPGGAMLTEMSENGSDFQPHMNACFLAVETLQRIVFTKALSGGWRPADPPYPVPMTALISFREHAEGTQYAAEVMHRNDADRDTHWDMGFEDGWGTVIEQLARLVER